MGDTKQAGQAAAGQAAAEQAAAEQAAPVGGVPGGGVPGGGAPGSRPGAGPRPEDGEVVDARHEAEGGHAADASALAGDVDELVAVAAQRDDYLALAQRTQADFENYRKRVARESAAAIERGVAKLATELLPALDSLDRALDGAAEDDPLLDGVRLVRAELHAALARAGVERFSPDGERFDPASQEAMAQRPAPDAVSGSVIEVYQPGYRIGPAIVRPARVVVAA